MTNTFKTVIRNPGAVAPSGNPSYNTDVVDRAIFALGTSSPATPSHVLAYIRAKKWPTTFTSGLVDRFNNPVASGTYAGNATRNAFDPNFNGQASVDLTNVSSANSGSNNGPFTMGPGFRLNQSLTTLPMSFTVVLSARLNTSPGTVNSIYSTSDGWGPYLTTSGKLNVLFSGSPDVNFSSVSAFLTPGGPANVSWWSYDSSTKIHRIGMGSSVVVAQLTGTVTYTPAANAKMGIFAYAGQLNDGQAFAGQFEGILVLDKCYMNGSVPADDALFTSLISTWASLI